MIYEKSPEGYIRVNLHFRTTEKSKWARKIIEDVVRAVCDEYHMSYFDNHDEIEFPDRGKTEHIAALIKYYMDIDTIPYHMPNVSSYGLLFKKDDPKIVEYILKYSDYEERET